MKFKIIYGFQAFEELIVRTSRAFKESHIEYLGMSVFRRYKENNEVSYNPLPPGSVFVGDKNFGSWKQHNSGEKVWRFFRIYRQIPDYLGWGDFLPTYDFFSKIPIYQRQNKPYFGDNNEFGLKGTFTKKAFPRYYERQQPQSVNWREFFKNYFQKNFMRPGINNE